MVEHKLWTWGSLRRQTASHGRLAPHMLINLQQTQCLTKMTARQNNLTSSACMHYCFAVSELNSISRFDETECDTAEQFNYDGPLN